MNPLSRIKQAGFTLSINNDNLLVAPASKLTQEQRSFIKQHKAEIFSELKAANETILKPADKAAILRWLHFIQENNQEIIDDVLEYCRLNPEGLEYYLNRSKEVAFDDRHYCRECQNLSNRFCIKQNFKPVDDIMRRCDKFEAISDKCRE